MKNPRIDADDLLDFEDERDNVLPDDDDGIEHVINRIAVIDCETDPFAKGRVAIKPFIWGYYTLGEYREFETSEALAEFLSDKDMIVYAHNGGRFDFHFLDKFLDPFQQVMIINGRIAKMMIGKCELRDSFNILPVGLAQYEKVKFDYAKMESDVRHLHMTEIRDYLKSDCVNTYNMITGFVRKYGLHLTQAGAAFKTWQKMSGQDAPKSDAMYYAQFHRYYVGGRVQCFSRGTADLDFKVADINSAYPWAMLDNHPLTTLHSSFLTWQLPRVLKEIEKRGPGAVFVSLRAISKGAFPWRGPDNALYFPDDNIEREYHVTGWELLAGLDTGTVRVREVTLTHIFHQMTNFKDYILHFYNLRKEAKKNGNKEDDLFAKLLMNSLYGKFAANPDGYAAYTIVPAEFANLIGDAALAKEMALQCGKVTRKYDLGRVDEKTGEPVYKFSGMLGQWALAERPLDFFEKTYYNIATSASITGCVRAYLWRTLCASDTPLYCDTDSIAAVAFKPDVLFSGELGAWKDEGDFDYYAIAGKKMYAFREKKPNEDGTRKWKSASKGVRLTPEELVTIANGGTVTYEPMVPTFSVHREPEIVKRRVSGTHKPTPKPEPKGGVNKNAEKVKKGVDAKSK